MYLSTTSNRNKFGKNKNPIQLKIYKTINVYEYKKMRYLILFNNPLKIADNVGTKLAIKNKGMIKNI